MSILDAKTESHDLPQAVKKTERTPLLSVIIPVYNAQDTIGRAIRSVLDTPFWQDIEIIAVDDCSSDDSVNIIKNIQKSYNNVYLHVMPQNSGGPSAPRNTGIDRARGAYVAFLDDDDWVDADRLLDMANYAVDKKIDFLKGYLYVVKDNVNTTQNRLTAMPKSSDEARKMIISYQSTTQDFLVRRNILIDNDLKYSNELKIGEDTVFILLILCHCKNIEYIDKHYLYYDKTVYNLDEMSSTRHCCDREVNDQITAWERAQSILSAISLNYFDIRLHAGFRNLLLSIVQLSDGISEETYLRLHRFGVQTEQNIKGKMNLSKRYEELYQAILSGDYNAYLAIAKRRLLIAGYDLKFILPVIPYLDNYLVSVDEWTGHNAHDKKRSSEFCEWADIIWCEWLLGNAVFYSELINDNQRLVIRAHRFEINRDFGTRVDYSKADMVIAVGFYFLEQFSLKFNIPRKKMRLLHNYVEEAIYSTDKSPDARYRIGLVGILPSLKGFYRGLELLKMLREKNPLFKLHIMGLNPNDVSWIANNAEERDYYKKCDKYIQDNELTEHIIYRGYVEKKDLYYEIGYVLSLSDVESFHLAPAEGACSGAMGLLLHWPGAEYIYPHEIIYNSIHDMAAAILHAAEDDDFYNSRVSLLREFVLNNYRIDKFLAILSRYLSQLFL